MPNKTVLALPGRVSAIGIVLPPQLSFDEWQLAWEQLQGVEQAALWWMGDLLNYGESRYGELYAQAVEATGFSVQTLTNAKYVSSRIELRRRRPGLSWGHHQAVAACDPETQDALLKLAEDSELSRPDLRKAVKIATAPPAIEATSTTVPDEGKEPENTEAQLELDNLKSALSAIGEENDRLKVELAKFNCPPGMDAATLLTELTESNKQLRREIAEMTKSRNDHMRENASMKKQMERQRKELAKYKTVEKTAAAARPKGSAARH